MNKDTNVEGLNVSPAIAKPMLPAAALWWSKLTTLQREWIVGNTYNDDEVTDERIEEMYHKDMKLSAEHAVEPNRFSGCR